MDQQTETAPVTRDAIAEAIVSDLSSPGQAASPPVKTESPADPPASPPATVVAPPEPVQQPPAVFRAKVRGQDIDVPLYEGSAINPAVVAAYQKAEAFHQKMQALADERKQFEAQKAEQLAALEAEKVKARAAALPQLPDDDPYAQRIKATEEIVQAALAQQQARFAALEAERSAAAAARLDADIQRVSSQHKLDEREMSWVGRELYDRLMRGEQSSLDSVAQEFVAYRNALRTTAIEEFKQTHRVGTPPATVGSPAAGPPETMPVPGSKGFHEAILQEIGARMR